MKVDILAIGVHPDDVELSCSGTLIKHVDLGYKVGILDLTRGELGTRGTPEIRLQEANIGAGIIGALFRENLGLKDGFFQNNEENQMKIIECIRDHQPDIVLANAIDDRHPDHSRAAELVHRSCFLAGLRKVQTSRFGVYQDPWRPKNLFHFIQDRTITPDFVVDIGDSIERKMESIRAFKSQFFDPDSKEPSSPISGKDFMDFIVAKARVMGREAGFEFGEGFNTHKKIGIKDLGILY